MALRYPDRLVLLYLAQQPGARLTYQQIGQACGVPSGTVGHAVRRLVASGYIRAIDRRRRAGYRYEVLRNDG